MRIKDIFQSKKPVLSFEIFPPKPDYPLDTVYQTVQDLMDLMPDFISVTYGAGGSNRARTIEIASHLKKTFQVETQAHLTCVGHSPEELDGILEELKIKGIENVLALRGDPPKDQPNYQPASDHYSYAVELIRQIRGKDGFCVGAAAYPEGHGQCATWQEDWDHLCEKVDAGVDFLLTQLFFDNRVFFNFLEHIRKMGINVPVSPGIMPVLNINQIKRMAYLSNASIPAALLKIFDQYGDNPEDFEKAGLGYAVQQINGLLAYGVDGIHFCTMNRVKQTREIVTSLSL